jgi:hypothetical protein
MKKQFTEEQIIKTLSRLKNGSTAKELCRGWDQPSHSPQLAEKVPRYDHRRSETPS